MRCLLFGDLLAQPGQFCPFRGSERLLSDCSGVVDASSFVGTYCPSRFLLNPRSWATSAMVWPESITLWRLRPCIGRKRFALAGHEDLLPAEPSVPPARYPPSGVNPRAFQRG